MIPGDGDINHPINEQSKLRLLMDIFYWLTLEDVYLLAGVHPERIIEINRYNFDNFTTLTPEEAVEYCNTHSAPQPVIPTPFPFVGGPGRWPQPPITLMSLNFDSLPGVPPIIATYRPPPIDLNDRPFASAGDPEDLLMLFVPYASVRIGVGIIQWLRPSEVPLSNGPIGQTINQPMGQVQMGNQQFVVPLPNGPNNTVPIPLPPGRNPPTPRP